MRRRALRASPGAARTAAGHGRAQWAEEKAADSLTGVPRDSCSMPPAHRAEKKQRFHSSPVATVRCTAAIASSLSLAPSRVVAAAAALAVVAAGTAVAAAAAASAAVVAAAVAAAVAASAAAAAAAAVAVVSVAAATSVSTGVAVAAAAVAAAGTTERAAARAGASTHRPSQAGEHTQRALAYYLRGGP